MAGTDASARGAGKMLVVAGIGVIIAAAALAGWRLVGTRTPAEPKHSTIVHPLGTFVVNMDPSDGFRYLKVTVALGVRSPLGPEELKSAAAAQRYQWSHAFVTGLMGLTYDQISSADGRKRLEERLIQRLNAAVPGLTVDAIYFVEFVAQ